MNSKIISHNNFIVCLIIAEQFRKFISSLVIVALVVDGAFIVQFSYLGFLHYPHFFANFFSCVDHAFSVDFKFCHHI